ncbi:MAG: YidC/Oxa1 family membrane protein insertase [Kiritimatiellae bacterium]|nr:YidC/Oxa1 family membrane protein insertase [Kiritimatiellia bacterium]
MEYLVKFFAWLMDWCHSWCPNWWADIVIFTFLTKILQFPVSLWCQVNSLKMVQLMPESNRIKMERYGDRDAIGDETAALFKREHYHPLLSLVPLAIQIVILMAFVKVIYGIGDRLTVPGMAKPLIACVPWTDGGVSWFMPLFAGAAAWLLGYSQNIFNPLQHEQTRTQQLITNGISICISLFLGCFVAAGVGLYWATSNIFSIVVQWGENWCIPPKKHVDYPRLRRSQAELRKFEEDIRRKSVVSPEDRRREKADYKRFFKVANKHLVFYAEGGGYYKYFKTVVEWLLEHSNVTIHYVTNDPKDGIFAMAAANQRIRAYFIGRTRIIPLMMKMDADMVVMTTPDLNTYQIKRSYVRKDVEYVYLDHGPTSVHMCYRKGAFDHFDTIMCNGPFQVAEHRATETVYGLKAKKLIESGYPLLDTLDRKSDAHGGDGVRIMVANSHQRDNIFDLCLDDLVSALLSLSPTSLTPPPPHSLTQTITIVLRPHPQYVRRNPARWQAIRARYEGNAAVVIEDDFGKPSTMDESDVLVTDWSGIAYEFAYKTRRPTLFVNTPMKVINPEWKKIDLVPTDISFRDEVGVSVDPEQLKPAADGSPAPAAAVVADMLARPDAFAAKIDRLFAEQFFNPGHAGTEVGKYILEALINRKKGKRK